MSGLAASPLGALIGLLMGAFGGGGSLVAIPLLVYVVDQNVREAQATSLVIVIIASIAGILAASRAGDVRWRAGAAFGLAAGAGALVGSLLSRGLDDEVLLLLFAPVMVLGAWAMVSERARRPASFERWRHGVSAGRVARTVALGVGVGLVIGLFGVGGGFVIVPVLVIVLRMGINEAIGTSLLAVTIAASFALGDRVASGDVDWAVAIPFAAAAALGALAGRSIAEGIDNEKLKRYFAGLVVVIALYTGLRSALALI